MDAIPRERFRHLERLRVRWAEVDMQHIVFNGHYLMYFDTAVAGYWRALALPYQDTMARLQGDLYVRKATLGYRASARYDEVLEVGMRCAHLGRSSMRFEAAVFRGEQCLVDGELVYVFADPQAQGSRPLPEPLRQALQAFEGGEPMLMVQTGSWDTLAPPSRALREAVFAREQGIAQALLCDAADETAIHALACNRLGDAVATGRLLAAVQGVGRIGRMATHAAVRGAGAGRAVLQALLAAARQRGDDRVRLHAQAGAIGFYERAGFRAVGERFEEAGIPHQAMEREP